MSGIKVALLTISLALCSSSAFAVRTAGGGGGDGCSACGPAPCCTIFGLIWCGCPFANNALAAGSPQARLIGAKCSSVPKKGTPLNTLQINALVNKLSRYKNKSASCEQIIKTGPVLSAEPAQMTMCPSGESKCGPGESWCCKNGVKTANYPQ